MREDYPAILKDFGDGEFPPEILTELRALLEQIGPYPVIVRSSSQLEDSLGRRSVGEDGFARLVWGLGTRAVERVGNDYPRLVALSHPTLLPDDSAQAIRYYSQHYVDLIDLEENCLKTLPVEQVLAPLYPSLALLVQREDGGFFTT